MQPYTFHRGSLPLLISVPHAGTLVPQEIADTFTADGRELPDTDWHVDRLYGFAHELSVSIVAANHSRYVVDLNRAADSASLYPDHPTSPVCPTHTFGGKPIYRAGQEPSPEQVADRIERYWRPYHQCIAEELWRMRSDHGFALLWDAHSILSQVPSLFAGELPAFNFGTRDGASCPQPVASVLVDAVERDGRYSCVLDGRFKGGYITQAYGKPADRLFAIQLELVQRTYMVESPPGSWDPVHAAPVLRLIRTLIESFIQMARQR